MAKILFIQNIWTDLLGVMGISSFLKSNGHESKIIIEVDNKKIMDEIRCFSPQIVGFSCMTGMHAWALEAAKAIKENAKNVFVVFGGPHSTLYPKTIESPVIDGICLGEGEYPVCELANAIDNKTSYTEIPNLWVKNNKAIFRNETRPLIGDLDKLPFPDRAHYKRYNYLRKNTMAFFMAGRGCPYDCAFCFNRSISKMQQGKYIRHRSPRNLIGEIAEYRREYPLKRIHFHDDTFILDKNWLFDFLSIYRDQVRIPFCCCIRADLVNEEIIRTLKDSYCDLVSFGIEHGNEAIRKNLLKKNVTNQQIINTAHLLKKYKIGFKTFNMIGLPTETLEDAYETVTLNQKIQPDYPWCSIFTPYPGTDLGNFAIKNNFVAQDFDVDKIPQSYLEKSLIIQGNISQLVNLQKFFYAAVKLPFFFPMIKKISKLPFSGFYNIMFAMFYLYKYIYRMYKMRIADVVKLAFYFLKTLKTSSKQ